MLSVRHTTAAGRRAARFRLVVTAMRLRLYSAPLASEATTCLREATAVLTVVVVVVVVVVLVEGKHRERREEKERESERRTCSDNALG